MQYGYVTYTTYVHAYGEVEEVWWRKLKIMSMTELFFSCNIQGWAMKWENFKTLKKLTHEFFICLLVINESI